MRKRFEQSMLAGLTFVMLLASGADAAEKIVPDVVYGHKHGMALTFDLIRPENQNGAGLLFIVSGGWYSRWSPPAKVVHRFRPLLDKGFTVFIVRHGSSPKYTIPEIVGDVRRSVRYIRLHADDFGIDAKRLGVHGGSAGGHLSLVLGTTGDDGDPEAEDPVDRAASRVAAVVAYYPPTDIREWVKSDSEYNRNYPALQFEEHRAGDFSPLLHVSPDDPPTLLVHGDKDRLVPISHSENILRKFQECNVNCELLVLEGAKHGFRGDDRQAAADRLVGWFETQLVGQRESR